MGRPSLVFLGLPRLPLACTHAVLRKAVGQAHLLYTNKMPCHFTAFSPRIQDGNLGSLEPDPQPYLSRLHSGGAPYVTCSGEEKNSISAGCTVVECTM